MSRFFSSRFERLVPYTPGEQPQNQRYVKLNTNESPFPPSALAVKAASEELERLELYPDPECRELIKALAECYGLKENQVVATNGSDEALYFAFLAYCDMNKGAVFADITYGFYKVFANFTGISYREIPLKESFLLDPKDYYDCKSTVFIANPNAPTGISLGVNEIEEIVRHNPNDVVVVDEAYVDFGGESCLKLLDRYDNLLIIRTFSKSRSMAGARLGFAMGNEQLIRDLNTIRYSTNPYNINRATLAASTGALKDTAYFESCIKTICENRAWAKKELEKLGFECTDSKTNFLFARHPKISGGELYEKLKRAGVLVRHFDAPRIRDYNRITVGTREQMGILIGKISKILEEKA